MLRCLNLELHQTPLKRRSCTCKRHSRCVIFTLSVTTYTHCVVEVEDFKATINTFKISKQTVKQMDDKNSLLEEILQ